MRRKEKKKDRGKGKGEKGKKEMGPYLKCLWLHEGGNSILGFLPLFIEKPCIESNRMYPFLF